MIRLIYVYIVYRGAKRKMSLVSIWFDNPIEIKSAKMSGTMACPYKGTAHVTFLQLIYP